MHYLMYVTIFKYFNLKFLKFRLYYNTYMYIIYFLRKFMQTNLNCIF